MRRHLKTTACGKLLVEAMQSSRDFNPVLAAILSFFIPGLGQIYKGQIIAGLLYFFGVPFLFCCGVGIVLHIISVVDAASSA